MIDKIKFFFRDKVPSLKQWGSFFKILNKNEKVFFLIVFCFFSISAVALSLSLYFSKTERVPAFGGSYSEGVIGYPRFFNPIYSPTSDVDRDITSLLFSELMEYSFSEGFTYNMIEYIENNETSIKIKLKDNLRWSDGERITAEDIIFTINVIQDPDYKSPLRPNWLGVEVEKISDLEVVFHLERPSMAFLNNLFLKIIPHHIWKDIPAQNFPLSKYNLNPVGSGPYKLKEIKKDYEDNIKKVVLAPNPYYHGKTPYIEEISFLFFNNEEEKFLAAQERKIKGFSVISPKKYQDIINRTRFTKYSFQIPRYFALFFNLDSNNIPERKMRSALELAIDKEAIIETVLNGRGERVDSPILLDIYGLDIENVSEFNPEKSKEIMNSIGFIQNDNNFRSRITKERTFFDFQKDLSIGDRGDSVRDLQQCLIFISENNPEIFPNKNITGFYGQETQEAIIRLQEKYKEEILAPWGFTQGTGMVGKSTRKKLNEMCKKIPEEIAELKFIITTVNQPLMIETAEMIKSQWEAVGIRTEIKIYDRISLKRDIIKPRNYDILLFGKAFKAIPDFFPFWHSSQKSEFGLNLTMFDNEDVDSILELLREEKEPGKRIELLEKLQNIILNDLPVISLYNPDYLYFVSPKVLGIRPEKIINPSNRFSGIEHWYINTRRVLIRK